MGAKKEIWFGGLSAIITLVFCCVSKHTSHILVYALRRVAKWAVDGIDRVFAVISAPSVRLFVFSSSLLFIMNYHRTERIFKVIIQSLTIRQELPPGRSSSLYKQDLLELFDTSRQGMMIIYHVA